MISGKRAIDGVRGVSFSVMALTLVTLAASGFLGGCIPIVRNVHRTIVEGRASDTQRTLAEPQQLAAASSEPVVGSLTIESLTPVASGPGLVVCEPVVDRTAASQASLGAGCARWLQFTIGGHGELGKTPLWISVDDARRALKRSDLRLTPADAAGLARHLGITHAATGRLTSKSGGFMLTYQLWTMPERKAVGAAVSVQGSTAQIAAALPVVARRLAQALGVTKPRVPGRSDVTAAVLQTLGSVPWEARQPLADAQRQQLLALAVRVPLAGLLYVQRGAYEDDAAWPGVVRTLIQQAPDNATVWGDTAWDGAGYLVPHHQLLQGQRQKFPNNYLLATAENRVLRQEGNIQQARQMAEHLVRCAPRNPRAWISLASTISNQAEQIRMARYSSDMSSAERRAIAALYPQWLQATQQATRVDPQYGAAWAEVATAATFAGQDQVADAALWKALSLDPTNLEAYSWGLQMYQPKWGADPQKLQKLVALAQARPEVYTQLAQRIAAALKASGLQAQAAQVLPQAIGILQARAARNPRDASAHEDLAYLLRNSKQYAQAVTHFQAWMRLEPRNAVPVHNLANMYLNRMNDADKAEPLYLKAMKMLPRDPHAPGALGALYKDFKRDYVKAEQMYRESLRRDPNYAYSLSGLANIYFFVKRDPQKAEQLFQQAIVSDPSNGRNYADYAWVLMQQGRRDEAIAQGRKAIALGEDDHPVLSQLGLS